MGSRRSRAAGHVCANHGTVAGHGQEGDEATIADHCDLQKRKAGKTKAKASPNPKPTTPAANARHVPLASTSAAASSSGNNNAAAASGELAG
jgi:hypothetical protein